MAAEVEIDFVLVEPLVDDYKCPLCLDVLKEPQLSTCCGRHFCNECIQKVFRIKKPCPLCNSEDFTVVLDKNVKRKILDLKVNCSNKQHGCDWVGEMRAFEKHIDPQKGQCKYRHLVCPNGCGELIPMQQLDRHVSSVCPKREVPCTFCGHKFQFVAIDEHYLKCTEFPVRCPNSCTEIDRLPRGKLYDHLQHCPMQDVQCRFARFGCSINVKRKDMPQHMRDYGPDHLDLMSAFCLDISGRLIEKDRQISEINHRLQESKQEVGILRDTQQKMQADFQMHLRVQQNALYRLQETDQRVANLGMQIQVQGERGESLRRRAAILETLVSVPPYYFTLTNFALHKRGTTQWMCPPFYNELGGYKLAIEISANGEGAGKGTHISVYIRIMRGEYDDILKWPLKASITIQLISQLNDVSHHEMTTPVYQWAQVVEGVVGTGWGWDKFVSHHDLEFNATRRTGFLRNDRLNFRVICVDKAV